MAAPETNEVRAGKAGEIGLLWQCPGQAFEGGITHCLRAPLASGSAEGLVGRSREWCWRGIGFISGNLVEGVAQNR